MAIANLQRSLVELGRIRLGRKTTTSKGGERPSRLDTFRFTSGAQHLIEEIAALYGGQVEPWDGGRGKQWEVITPTALIPVYIPPQRVEPWMESWANGVCTRRCDTERDIIKDEPCSCNPEKRVCRPTTRVNVMLADVPGLGVWRVETHGWWAAGELAQLSDLINGIKVPLPARLMLEKRGGKRFNRETQQVETLDYNVPVLLLDNVTSRHVALGQDAVSQALRASGQLGVQQEPHQPQAAIETASATPALEAAPARQQTPPPAEPDPAMIQRALAAIATASPDQMEDIHRRIVKMGRPAQVLDAFKERLGQQEIERRQAQAPADPEQDPWAADDTPATPPAAPPAAIPEPEQPPAPTGASEAVPYVPVATGDGSEGDRQASMTRLLGVAGSKGINRRQLEQRLQSDCEASLKTATALQLDTLAASL